jgi:hypothetical protein
MAELLVSVVIAITTAVPSPGTSTSHTNLARNTNDLERQETVKWAHRQAGTVATSATPAGRRHPTTAAMQYNVVFMVMDDARPDQEYAYGQPDIHTPNMDRLGRTGLVFRKAYSQFPVCGPSRSSFMSGRRPDTTRVFNFLTSFRDAPGGNEWVSLPQHFKERGYTTLGSGKLYHTNCAPTGWSCDSCTVSRTENQPPNQDEPFSWSQDKPYPTPCQEYCQPQPGAPAGGRYGGPAACGDPGPFTRFNDYNSTVIVLLPNPLPRTPCLDHRRR